MTIKDLQAEIDALKKRIAELESRRLEPKQAFETHYHYHYGQVPVNPYLQGIPQYIPPWTWPAMPYLGATTCGSS
jgi:hypothetical protein